MTVAVVSPINSYVGNASASSFSFTFPVFLSSQILVTFVVTATGATTTGVLGTDYTVSGLNASGDPATTGSITLINSSQAWLSSGNLNTGWTLVIQANFALSQTTSIRNQGDFYRAALENALDTLEYQIQQLELQLGSQLILPTGLLPTAFSPILPVGMPGSPGLALVVNAAGTALALGAGSSVTLPISIAQGGTNSTSALANAKMMASSAGKIVEVAADSSMGSNKITNLKDGSSAQDAAAFGQIKLISAAQTTETTLDSVTSSTFTATSLTKSITPSSASNRVKITITTNIKCPAGRNAFLTIKRGSTDLGFASSSGLTSMSNGTAVTLYFPVTIVFIDSPATTSSTTYTVYMRNDDNATAIKMSELTLGSTIILEEIV